MTHFTHAHLSADNMTTPADIRELCTTYNLDCDVVVSELDEFRHAYRSIHYMVIVDDLVVNNQVVRQNMQNYDSDDDGNTNNGDGDVREYDEDLEEVSLVSFTGQLDGNGESVRHANAPQAFNTLTQSHCVSVSV